MTNVAIIKFKEKKKKVQIRTRAGSRPPEDEMWRADEADEADETDPLQGRAPASGGGGRAPSVHFLASRSRA